MTDQALVDRLTSDLADARSRVDLADLCGRGEAVAGLHAAVRAAQGVVPLLVLAGFLSGTTT